MMPCVILSIGEELLEGTVIDTNSAFIAKQIAKLGICSYETKQVRDDVNIIADTIRSAMAEYPLVLTTGGLGPTFDDLTMEAVAIACEMPVTLNDIAMNHIIARLSKIGVELREGHKRQAMLPKEATVLPNEHGSALGTIVRHNNSMVISMPGVPYEMKPMLTESVMPYLKEYFELGDYHMEDLRFIDTPESDVDAAIQEISIPKDLKCIINASLKEVVVKLRGENEAVLKGFASKLMEKLSGAYIGGADSTPAGFLIELLRGQGKTLAVAESCTGGLLGANITAVSGASSVFAGGVISYSNEVKINQLKVAESTIKNYGAVSEECAREMAAGAQKLINSDYALSITGVAGPDGGTEAKPVGTVCIGLADSNGAESKLFKFPGDRDTIRTASVRAALAMLINKLR